jgi:outer membrane protein
MRNDRRAPSMKLRVAFAMAGVWGGLAPQLSGQEPQVERPRAPLMVRPYKGATVSREQLKNGNRMSGLVRAGTLYLTVQDALAIAIENNLDLEIDRFGPVSAEWELEHSQAGGAKRGVTNGNAAVNQVTAGQGVAGAAQAAGLSSSGGGGGGGSNTNAVVSQVGPITPNLDAVFQNTTVFSHTTTLFPDTILSEAPSLIDTHNQVNSFVQQGLLTGGYVQATLNYSYLKENSPADLVNPDVSPVVQLYIRHNFLQGFGKAVNARDITVHELGLTASRETFRSQLLNLVANVLNLYWDLAASQDEMKVRQRALEAAQKTLNDTTKQIELGVVARVEAYRAQAGVSTRRQELEIAQANLRQQELLLKNVLSRQGLEDPMIDEVSITPLDHMEIPETDELPALRDLLARALAHRPDVAIAKIADEQQQIQSLGTANGILPTLQGIAATSDIGQAGKPNPSAGPTFPPFIGGAGTAFSQIFRRDYPTNRAALYFQILEGNHVAQGDYGIDQLQLKQGDLIERRNLDQIVVDISNQIIALRQARARYAQSLAGRELQRDLLEKEQQMFSFGSATLNDVVAAQASLLAAESAEVTARSAYSHARVSLDQVLGETLERNHVAVEDALKGEVRRRSSLPSAAGSAGR